MKELRVIWVSIIIVVFSFSIFGQTVKTPNTISKKIASVNTEVFKDENKGINELLNAYTRLWDEFKFENERLHTIVNKIIKVRDWIKSFQQSCHPSLCSSKLAQEKIKKYELLVQQYKTLVKDIRPKIEARKKELIEPVNEKIKVSLEEYVKQKGYTKIIFVSDEKESIASKNSIDITREFIAYYNKKTTL